jgi:hypothetical protein
MELVEGEDLADRIARGPIPVDEALPIARQIADALDAAHEQGIVHRDLKPSNIKVRADGTVKVLDFGLAKVTELAGGSSRGLSMSPTLSNHATQAGIILGTVAYMSPEQAAGKPVDKRSDVWSFGVVVLEMLTGRPVFTGETLSHVLASVLKSDPDWTALPATVPARVVNVLRRCLQKDRKQRVRDIGDVSLALDGTFETAAPQAMRGAASSVKRERLAWMAAVAVAAVAIVGLAIPAVRYLRATPLPRRASRSSPPPRTSRCRLRSRPTAGRSRLWHLGTASHVCGSGHWRRRPRSHKRALKAHAFPFGRPTAAPWGSSSRMP